LIFISVATTTTLMGLWKGATTPRFPYLVFHCSFCSCTNSYVEHICISETILWVSEKERKYKRMMEHQQYCKT
jgi:hypothetical protein